MLKRKKKLTDIGFFDSGFLMDLDTFGFLGFGFFAFPGYWMIDCYQSTSATKLIAVPFANNRKTTLFLSYGFYLGIRKLTMLHNEKG